MVKIIDVVNIELSGKVIYKLFADTKAEVATATDMPADVGTGSTITTGDNKSGVLGSDGTWAWAS